MKVRETLYKDKERGVSTLTFTIIGDTKVGSLETPIWEKSIQISDIEAVQFTDGVFERIKESNAMSVFQKFYRDVHLTTNPPRE